MNYQLDVQLSPWIHFDHLMEEAAKKIPEYNAMDLATVDSQGQPNCRIVYFKTRLRGGIGFYTNYQGQKSQEISVNNKVCANFYWREWNQQIRVQGVVEKMTREESEAYFKTRARLSQLGAWASHQSEIISHPTQVIEKKITEYDLKFKDQDVPCPNHWGGFLIIPTQFEFWFGREGRLHERYVYSRKDLTSDKWLTTFKSP